MTDQQRVRLEFDDASFARVIARSRRAADANPIRENEDPIDWLRRIADAAFWEPDGWEE